MNGNEVKVSAKNEHGNAINSSATNIVIPATVTNGNNTYTVTEIADNGFQDMHSLQEVTIPRTVITIGDYAFANCSALEGMHIPNPDCQLGKYIFHNCHNLSFINLPTNLTKIPEGLLMNCDTKLRSIVIPEKVTLIESNAFGQTHDANIIFLGCGDANKEITVKSDAFANSHDDFIEFFCTDTIRDQNETVSRSVRLKIVPVNQWSSTSPSDLFGNNLEGFQVPCGMETYYAVSIYENDYTSDEFQEINAGELCIAVSKQNGDFCLPETWRGYDKWIEDNTAEWTANNNGYPINGTYEAKETWLKNVPDDPDDDRYPDFMPRDPMDPFIIKHEVTLKHRRDIYAFTSVNNGILVIDATGGDKDGQLV